MSIFSNARANGPGRGQDRGSAGRAQGPGTKNTGWPGKAPMKGDKPNGGKGKGGKK